MGENYNRLIAARPKPRTSRASMDETCIPCRAADRTADGACGPRQPHRSRAPTCSDDLTLRRLKKRDCSCAIGSPASKPSSSRRARMSRWVVSSTGEPRRPSAPARTPMTTRTARRSPGWNQHPRWCSRCRARCRTRSSWPSAPTARSRPIDPNHAERAVQRDMALAVAAAIEDRAALVVEAGTGVGKTFAYLVPALLSGARTLLSTATKTLQDQLFVRDLPRLRTALNLPVTVALLKGRSSYLCLHRLGRARQDAQLPDRFAVRALAKVEAWAQTTASGDLAELDGLDERSSIVPLVTSSRENCLGSECPEYRQCHVDEGAARGDAGRPRGRQPPPLLRRHGAARQRRRRAAAERRGRDLRRGAPARRGRRAVSRHDARHRRSSSTSRATCSAAGLQQARGLAPWQELAAGCDRAARELRLAAQGDIGEVRGSLKLRWAERSGGADFLAALTRVGEALRGGRRRRSTR